MLTFGKKKKKMRLDLIITQICLTGTTIKSLLFVTYYRYCYHHRLCAPILSRPACRAHLGRTRADAVAPPCSS